MTDSAASEPNRVHGGLAGSFLYEPLGATKPLGKIKGGTWGIVVDECQNGVFDTGEDTFVDNAFKVDLDQFVPSIGPENASFLAMKERAGKGATALEDLETLLQLHTLFEQARAAYSLATAFTAQGAAMFIVNGAITWVEDASGYQATMDAAKQLARETLLQHKERLKGLHADPPDPNFTRFALPAAAGAHMEESTLEIGELWSEYVAHLDGLSALTGAILDSVERYQGAGAAGDAQWALRHARTVERLTVQYESLLADFSSVTDALKVQVTDEFDHHDLQTFVWRFDSTVDDFPAANLAKHWLLRNTGQDPLFAVPLIQTLRGELSGPLLEREAEWLGIIDTARQSVVDFAGTFSDFRTLIASHSAELETTLDGDDEDPALGIVLTGTPSAGAQVTLDVAGLAGPASVMWDLDGDGEPDDATGESVTWTVPGDAIAGVPLFVGAVATGEGFATDASLAVKVIAGGNQPPEVAGPLTAGFPEVSPGDSVPLTVVASDPDGDPLTYQWLVDGEVQPGETSPSFTLNTAPTDFGGRSVEVLIRDGQALTRAETFIMIVTPDADNDQYLAYPGPDCTEVDTPEGVSAKQINPWKTEIPGNGADDDCNPATPDDYGPLGWTNISGDTAKPSGAFDTRTLPWSHPRKFSGDEFTLTWDWGDDTPPTVRTVSGTTSAELDFGDLTHQWGSQKLSFAMRACIVHHDTGQEFCDEHGMSVVNNRPVVNAADFRTFGPPGLGYATNWQTPSGEWLPLDENGQRMESSGNPSNYVILPSNDPLPEGAGYGRVSYDQQTFGWGDDDWIGLVLGYQEGEEDSPTADFAGVWWGGNLAGLSSFRSHYCNDAPPEWPTAPTSYVQAFRQNGQTIGWENVQNVIYDFPYDAFDDGPAGEPPQDPRCSDDMGRTKLAEVPTDAGLLGSKGWAQRASSAGNIEAGWRNSSYLIEIDYQPDSLTMWIDGEQQLTATPTDPGDPFPPGGVGLYYHSQAGMQMAVTAPEKTFHFTQGKGGPFNDDPADGISVPMHDSPFDTHTVRINWGDATGTTEGTKTANAAAGEGWFDITGTHVYERAGTFRGEVCVTDQHNAGMCFPFTSVVANVAPTVDAGSNRPVDAEVTLTDMSFQDPGRFDTHTATVDWGDGTGAQPATVNAALGGGIVSGSHTYVTSGEMTLEVCVEDQHGDAGCDTRTLTVNANNDTPQVSVAGASTLPEGSQVTVPVGFNDGNVDDTHTATVDWGDGGAVQPVSLQDGGDFGSGEASHTFTDNGVFTVTVEVCDQKAACSRNALEFTVTNEDPSVTTGVSLSSATATLAGTYTDPGVDDTHTATVDWGEGAGPQPVDVTPTAPGSGDVNSTHVYSATGEYQVTLCVTDVDTGSGCDGVTLEVTELDGTTPAVTVDGVAPAVEGDTVTVNASFIDGDAGDTHTATVDWGDGTAVVPATVDNTADTTTANHVYTDNDSGTPFVVTVTVCDSTQLCDAATTDVSVVNADPIVDAGRDRVWGNNLMLDDTTFTDPGSSDTHTATVDWGAGAGPVAAFVVGSTVQASHYYPSTGVRTVTVCVTDDDAATACDSFQATITPESFPLESTPPAAVNEGTLTQVTFLLHQPWSEPHTATARWSDGSPPEDIPLGAVGMFYEGSISHTYTDNGDFGVTFEVCREVAVCAWTSVTASVLNVPPTVQPPTGAVSDATLDIEATYTDPGTSDTHTATVDWGDGNVTSGVVAGGAGAGTVFGTHTYLADGTYTVEVCVTDDDGGFNCASSPHTVAVPNVVPVLQVDPLGALTEGGLFQLTGSFADLDPDTWTLTADFGDGTGPTVVMLPTSGAFTVPYTYADDGTFTVTVTVSDGFGEDTVTLFGVDVTNIAPSLDVSFDVNSLDVTLVATSSDPGDDELSATVDWGDGTVEDATATTANPAQVNVMASTVQFSASHSYRRSGTWNTNVCTTDDNMARTCVQKQVSVTAPPPPTTTPPPPTDDTVDPTPNDTASPPPPATTTPLPPSDPGPDSSVTPTQLPRTGASTLPALQIALTLVLVGFALLLTAAWRRRKDQAPSGATQP